MINQREYEKKINEGELQRPEHEKIREKDLENYSNIVLAGATGFILGKFSNSNLGKYLLGVVLGAMSGYFGNDYLENENTISAQGVKVVERKFGNTWTGNYTFPVVEIKGKNYLFETDNEGNLRGIREIDEIRIDIKNKEAYAGGLEYITTEVGRKETSLKDLDSGLLRKLKQNLR